MGVAHYYTSINFIKKIFFQFLLACIKFINIAEICFGSHGTIIIISINVLFNTNSLLSTF